MKKSIRSLAYLFLIAFLSHIAIFANTKSRAIKLESTIFSISNSAYCFIPISGKNSGNRNESFVPPAPSVTSPIYLCQGSTADPLSATASPGATLIWYGTAANGGTASPTAPTPSTTAVGQTKYYVSQMDGTGESPRAEIIVNVVADNGATILGFRCDPTQATTTTSVFFDWSNNPLISNSYNYSYSISGGATVTGSTGVSHQEVFGMAPGQSATLTLSSATHPCVPPLTLTCTVPCGTSTVTPTFTPIPPFCSGTTPAPLLPAVSNEGIAGTWSPAIVNNTTSAVYTFTPDPILFPCALTQTMSVTVDPLVTPAFSGIPAIICQGAEAPTLPRSSSNVTPINGIWSPATVNTAVLGSFSYTFTPDPGQCTSATPTSISIRIDPVLTPSFTAVPDICSGDSLSALPTISNNGISGSWSPSLNNTATTSYTFTPAAGQCATTATMTISVTASGTPTFTAVPAICTGDPISPLPTVSDNGYTGTWSPALDNTTTTNYTFTPDASQCATVANLTITVNQLVSPTFIDIPDYVCENDIPPVLPASSSDTPSITGSWNPSAVDTSVVGTNDFVFTPDAGQCADELTIAITVSPANTLVDFQWTVTEAFSENQMITITATGAGNYLYQLDDGPFQESPVFEHVSAGYHSVTVEDATGCSLSITKSNILVIDYPRFFTPNNDGYNDMWNVFTLEDKSGSKIQIFDRYGKLLKEIRPNGSGWNGTFNGRPLPATDYWFVVDYPEDGTIKKFRSHFSLKR